MKESYMSDCFVKFRDGDIDIISGAIDGDKVKDVTVRLNRYAIIPREEHDAMLSTSGKAAKGISE